MHKLITDHENGQRFIDYNKFSFMFSDLNMVLSGDFNTMIGTQGCDIIIYQREPKSLEHILRVL